jgi:hypothetical protein
MRHATFPKVGHFIRLRISLADRAGALAQAATIVGLHGGNIRSIDVHRTDDESAVDDLVVDFSKEPDMEDLGHDLATNAATALLSHQASHATDPVVASMQRVMNLLGGGLGDPDEALADAVADLCSAPVAWVSTVAQANRHDAGRVALEGNRAVALPATTLPEHLAERLPGEVRLLAVPDSGHPAGGRVVFVARSATSEFTATEIARIEALITLDGEIERTTSRRGGAPQPGPT